MRNTMPNEPEITRRVVRLHYGGDDVETVDLYEYLAAVWRRKWLVGAIALACTAAAIAAALLMTPVYRAETLLLTVEEEQVPELGNLTSRFSGLASLAGINVSVGSAGEEALATLTSRGFIEHFVRDLDLMPVLFADQWDAETKSWNSDDSDDIPTMYDAYEKFDEELLKVNPDWDTGLVTVAIEWENPAQAADWVNLMVSRVNAEMRARAIDEATRTIDALNAELQSTSVIEMRQAIFRLAEAQIQKRILAKVRNQYSFRVIDTARAPDEDQHIRPKRPVLVAAGLVLGLTLGIGVALLLELLAKARAARRGAA